MRWTTVCSGCGMALRFGDAQKGRHLQCPACRQRVTGEPLREAVASPPSPKALTPRRLRRWILAGLLGLLLGGLIVAATQVNWFEDPPVSKRVLGPGQIGISRDGKSKNGVVEL